jgi:hypothetical protein
MIAILGMIGAVSFYKISTQPPPPKALEHTLEYDSIFNEHINDTKVVRLDVDTTTVKQDLSARFGVYRFYDPKLHGPGGNLHVFIDRRTNETTSRSLWAVNQKPAPIKLEGECFLATQTYLGTTEDYEICIR